MDTISTSGEYIPPVRCPNCGERQNRFSGLVDQENHIFEKTDCMVCGHVFAAEEYQDLLSEALCEPPVPVGALD